MFTLIQNYKNTFISFIRNELNEWVSVGLQEDLWLLSNDQDIKDALSEIKKIMDEQVENDWIIWEGWEVWAKLFGSYTKKQIIEKWLWKNELDLSDNWIIDKQIIKLLEKMKDYDASKEEIKSSTIQLLWEFKQSIDASIDENLNDEKQWASLDKMNSNNGILNKVFNIFKWNKEQQRLADEAAAEQNQKEVSRKAKVNALIKRYRGDSLDNSWIKWDAVETKYEKDAKIKALFDTTINKSEKSTLTEIKEFEDAMNALDNLKPKNNNSGLDDLQSLSNKKRLKNQKEWRYSNDSWESSTESSEWYARTFKDVNWEIQDIKFEYIENWNEWSDDEPSFDVYKITLWKTWLSKSITTNTQPTDEEYKEAVDWLINEYAEKQDEILSDSVKNDISELSFTAENLFWKNPTEEQQAWLKNFWEKIELSWIKVNVEDGEVDIDFDFDDKWPDEDHNEWYWLVYEKWAYNIESFKEDVKKEAQIAVEQLVEEKTKEAEQFKQEVLKQDAEKKAEAQEKAEDEKAKEIQSIASDQKFTVKQLLWDNFKDIDATSDEMAWLREFDKDDLTKSIELDDVNVDMEKGTIEFSFDDDWWNESFNEWFKVSFDKNASIEDITSTFRNGVAKKAKTAVQAKKDSEK